MRSIVLILSLVCILTACQNTAQKDGKLSPELINNPVSASSTDTAGKAYPKIHFIENSFNFGQIKQGEKIQHAFKFKNTGKTDLIISSAEGSCGCTIPEYPKDPIKPGQENTVNIVFNSEGKHGKQHKTITIVANTIPNSAVIELNGEVLVPEAK